MSAAAKSLGKFFLFKRTVPTSRVVFCQESGHAWGSIKIINKEAMALVEKVSHEGEWN